MLAILASWLLGATPPPAPLRSPAPVADRGEVRSGPQLVHTFRVEHAGGPGVVTITGVETGCGCVRSDLSRRTLGPGDVADLTVAVNTLTQPAGPNTWGAVVRYQFAPDSGPPSAHQLELLVRAAVVREVTVTPPELAFSTAGSARQALVIADRRPTPLTVVRASATAPFVTAAPRAPARADGTHAQSVEIAVSADAPNGEWSEVVTLTTDDPGYPELRIPVRVVKRAAAAVTATPAAIDLRFAAGQTTLSGVIQLRAGGRPVRIEKVSCTHPAVAVTHSEVGPVATLRVSIDGAAAGNEAGRTEVTVTLAEPSGQDVTIPVRWDGR